MRLPAQKCLCLWLLLHGCWIETIRHLGERLEKSFWFQQNYFPIFDACAPMHDMMCDAYSYISDSLAPRAVKPGGSQRRRGRSGAWPPPWEGPCPSCSPKFTGKKLGAHHSSTWAFNMYLVLKKQPWNWWSVWKHSRNWQAHTNTTNN